MRQRTDGMEGERHVTLYRLSLSARFRREKPKKLAPYTPAGPALSGLADSAAEVDLRFCIILLYPYDTARRTDRQNGRRRLH